MTGTHGPTGVVSTEYKFIFDISYNFADGRINFKIYEESKNNLYLIKSAMFIVNPVFREKECKALEVKKE